MGDCHFVRVASHMWRESTRSYTATLPGLRALLEDWLRVCPDSDTVQHAASIRTRKDAPPRWHEVLHKHFGPLPPVAQRNMLAFTKLSATCLADLSEIANLGRLFAPEDHYNLLFHAISTPHQVNSFVEEDLQWVRRNAPMEIKQELRTAL